MKEQSKAAKAKLTQSTTQRAPVPVQDLHLEVPANTWANMIKVLMQ